jgi:hypothetical protein
VISSARYLLIAAILSSHIRRLVLIIEQQPTLQKVFVVTINSAADVAVCIGPLTGLDVNPGSHQADWRTSLVGFDQSAFCFVVEDGPAREFRQRAEFDQ